MNARISSYILALIFFASGGAKLLSLPFEVDAFLRWGYPREFMYFTGIVEIIGAFGLLITRLSSLSSLCLGEFDSNSALTVLPIPIDMTEGHDWLKNLTISPLSISSTKKTFK